MRLFSRARLATGVQKVNWLFLAGVNGGAAIWTTHFVAMLGYVAAGGGATILISRVFRSDCHLHDNSGFRHFRLWRA